MLCGLVQPFGAGKLRKRLYPYERARADDYTFTTRAKTGSPFTSATSDFHAHPLAVCGYSDWRNWAIALAACGPGDLIVEVGANIGTETVGFSDIVGPTGRVLAFEPLPSNVAALEAAMRGFRYANVTLLPYALSDRAGSDSFAVPPASMSQGTGHLLGPAERATGTATYYDEAVEMSYIQVESRMLDEFVDQVGGVRLLVADAEGSEVSILRGAHRVLKRERPAMVLEASKTHQRRAGMGITDLHEELVGLRYTVYAIRPLDLEEVVDPELGPEFGNWLCVPQERPQLTHRVRRYLLLCGLMPFVFGLNPLTRPRRR
jgi:FkbM family methyltransferase